MVAVGRSNDCLIGGRGHVKQLTNVVVEGKSNDCLIGGRGQVK